MVDSSLNLILKCGISIYKDKFKFNRDSFRYQDRE